MIAAPDALEAADSVPQAAPVHPAPLSVQVTPLFCASCCTVAVRFWVFPACTVELGGVTLSAMSGAEDITVTCAVSTAVVCACAIAVTVTVAGEGTVAGAVYTPSALMVPCAESPPCVLLTCHITAVLEAFCTDAVNVKVFDVCTDALGGSTETTTAFVSGILEADLTLPHPQTDKTPAISAPVQRGICSCPNRLKAIVLFPSASLTASFLFRGM